MSAIEPKDAPGQRGDTAAALSVRNVSKSFGAQRALQDFDLEIGVGEIHALVGANGSGKSTFVKALAGYHRPDSGAIATVVGHDFALGSAPAARQAGLRFVHQNLGLVDRMEVAENFRLEGGGRALLPLHRRRDRADAERALTNIGYDISPTAKVADLVESERTAVALARALDDFNGVPLLVLDEPTASLPAPEVERLFAALRRVAAGGTAILFISHHLDEVLGLADRVTVLRDGVKVTTAPVGELSQDQLIELMLGRQLVQAEARHERELEDRPESVGPARFEARGLGGETVESFDIELRPGEVLGIAGITGSGREEIAGLLSGRLPRDGIVSVNGATVPPGDPRAAIDAGICYVPADRAAQALLPKASVRENLTLGRLGDFWAKGRMRRGLERKEAAQWVERMDVRPAQTEKKVTELSGGNQQKVVMARWFRVAPGVLVLDEPTQGVDVGSKADIHRLVDEAAAAGAAVVVCSTDDDELARLSTEVVVMRRGRAAVRLTGAAITAEHIEEEQLRPDEPAASAPAIDLTDPEQRRRDPAAAGVTSRTHS